MAGINDLTQALRYLNLNRIPSKIPYTRGLLGNGQGQVAVPGRPDFSYVRPDRFSNRVAEYFNKRVTGQDGTPVIVGTLPWEPDLTQVLDIDWETYKAQGWGAGIGSVGPHGRSHEWKDAAPGYDTFNVYRRQLGDLKVYPLGSGSTSVNVTPYSLDWLGEQISWPGTIGYDLSGAIPSSSGTARMALVWWSPASGTTGFLGVSSGSVGIDSDAILLDRPSAPPGTIPSAWVKLRGGQTQVREFDIHDAREPFRPGLAFGTGTTQVNAALIPISPIACFTGTSVQTALGEICDDLNRSNLWQLEGGTGPNIYYASGSVGIGITSPVSILHTVGGAVRAPTWTNYGYGAAPTILGVRTRGTEASPTAVQDGDNLWLLAGYGYDGSTARLAGEIRMAAASPTGTSVPADIVFRTHDSSLSAGATSEKMRLLSGGDLQISSGGDLLLTGNTAPQSQSQNGVIDTIGHILDGGHPLNSYPASHGDDDAEFNNGTQADNNSIGSIAGGDYWEWLANNPAAANGAVSINTIRSHLSVKVARPDGDASLQADLAASVPAATEVLFTACLRYLRPFTTTSDEYFAIRLLDVSTTNYYEVSYRNNGSGAMSIQSFYIDGGARTQDGSTVTLTEVPAALWLQWRQQSNTTYRAQMSYDGLSFFPVQSAAKTFANTFVADRIILIFGQSDSASLTNITYNVDSVRRT